MFKLNLNETPFDVTKVIMPFGKYRGNYIGDIPTNYLNWLLDENINLSDDLKAAITHYTT